MVNEKDTDKEFLIELIRGDKDVVAQITQRDKDFRDGKKLVESFKTAKIPEPRLKPQGGADHKRPDYSEQKKEALLNMRETYQKQSTDIAKTLETNFTKKGFKKELNDLRNHNIHHLVDECVERHNHDNNDKLVTQKEFGKYMRKNGIKPYETRDNSRPLDKEPKDKIPEPEKPISSKDQKAMNMSKNKRDMGMDRDR